MLDRNEILETLASIVDAAESGIENTDNATWLFILIKNSALYIQLSLDKMEVVA